MKNKFIALIIVFFGFFFFSCFNVNASTQDVTLDFDVHEHFNFYYEMVNNTSFYRFIISKGDNLNNYFNSLHSNYHDFPIYVVYSRDLSINYPDNAYYTFVIGANYFRYLGGSYCFSSLDSRVDLLHFDQNLNFISTTPGVGTNFSYCQSNFSYVLGSLIYGDNVKWSKYYGLSNNQNDIAFDVRISRVTFDHTDYLVSNLKTRSGLINFIERVSTSVNRWFDIDEYYDLSSVGMEYFLTNFVIKDNQNSHFVSCYEAINYNNNIAVNISVPDGFNSVSFNYDDRYYLIPNSTSCSDSENVLYFSSSDTSTINFIGYSALSDSINYYDFQSYSFKLNRANTIQALSLHSVIGSNNLIKDYIYLVSSSDNFSTNNVYFNSSCFTSYTAISGSNLEFENVNTGNTVSLTPAEQQFMYYSFSNSMNDLIRQETSYTELDISSIVGGAWNGAKTFVSSSYYILSMVTNIFVSLPSEVASLLLCVFSLGMIIILWKVFRGG